MVVACLGLSSPSAADLEGTLGLTQSGDWVLRLRNHGPRRVAVLADGAGYDLRLFDMRGRRLTHTEAHWFDTVRTPGPFAWEVLEPGQYVSVTLTVAWETASSMRPALGSACCVLRGDSARWVPPAMLARSGARLMWVRRTPVVCVSPRARRPKARDLATESQRGYATHVGRQHLSQALNGLPDAEPGPRPNEDSTLGEAVRRLDLRRVRGMLATSENPNTRSADGGTALHDACAAPSPGSISWPPREKTSGTEAHRRRAICAALLAAGADPWRPAPDGSLAVEVAARHGRSDLVRLLLGQPRCPAGVGEGLGPALAEACYRRYRGVAEELLRFGVDPARAHAHNRGALEEAVRAGDSHLVRMLLRYGADPSWVCSDGWPLLSIAAYQGRLDLVRALTKGGADVSAVDREGTTAAMWAFLTGHDRVLEYLEAVSGRGRAR